VRKAIAVLIDHLDHDSGGYESELRTAFDRACRRLDANLLVVQGYALDDPDPKGRAHNAVYEFVGPTTARGCPVSVQATRRACTKGADEVWWRA
jgi:hypothetical protein